MERYIIDVENCENELEPMPLTVSVRKVNIDPKGYELATFVGSNLDSLLKRAIKTISAASGS